MDNLSNEEFMSMIYQLLKNHKDYKTEELPDYQGDPLSFCRELSKLYPESPFITGLCSQIQKKIADNN